MFGDEAGEEGAVDAAGDVVAGGDGEEGAGVVVEADGVVEAGGLGGLFAEAHHAFGRVVEPPGRAEFERGVVAGEGGEFAGVGGLVEGEEDEGEAGVVAVLVEQRAKGAGRTRWARACRRPCRGRTSRRRWRLWLRTEPGWSCMVRPSSTLMPAISVSIWAWKRADVLGGGACRSRMRA